MDGAELNDRFSRGLGAAARAWGMPLQDLYRPAGPGDPVRPERLTLRLPVALDGGSPGYGRPRGFERALRATFDVMSTSDGDYLVGPRGVLFIAARPVMLRPLCVLANAVVSVLRPGGAERAGLNGYGGVRDARLQTVLARWPVEMTASGDGAGGTVPDDSAGSRWSVLLPVSAPAVQASDLVQHAEGRRFVVRSAERTEFGWRLSVKRAGV